MLKNIVKTFLMNKSVENVYINIQKLFHTDNKNINSEKASGLEKLTY